MKDYRVNVAIAVLIALPCFGQKSANDYITIVGKQHPELIDEGAHQQNAILSEALIFSAYLTAILAVS